MRERERAREKRREILTNQIRREDSPRATNGHDEGGVRAVPYGAHTGVHGHQNRKGLERGWVE